MKSNCRLERDTQGSYDESTWWLTNKVTEERIGSFHRREDARDYKRELDEADQNVKGEAQENDNPLLNFYSR